MKTYLSVFRIRFIATLQYRFATLAGLVTQFVWGFMEILVYAAFYKVNAAAFPMEFSQIVSYIWMQQAFLPLFSLSFWDWEFSDAIESGSISYELVRPVDLYGRWFFQAAAKRLARVMLRCIPAFLVAFFLPEPYRMVLPPDFVQLLLFFMSVLLALCVVVAFSMLMYISVFYTLSSRGTKLVVGLIADFFAGMVILLPFFPEALQNVIRFLPFAAMQNMPLRIYSGNIAGMEAVIGITLQVLWIVILLMIGKFTIRRALSKVVVQGG